MKASAYPAVSSGGPTNKYAAAPGGVQRNDRNDSACLKSTGAIWPKTAALKPATAPISATSVSPRARLRRSSNPIVVESHFDRAMPKSNAGNAARGAAVVWPVPNATPKQIAITAGIGDNQGRGVSSLGEATAKRLCRG